MGIMTMDLPWENAKTALLAIKKLNEEKHPLTETGTRFRGAVASLLRRIEAGDKGPLSSAMLRVMQKILGSLEDHRLSARQWTESTITVLDLYLEGPDPLPGRLLYEAFRSLISCAVLLYRGLWKEAREAIPDPHILADKLGILTWDFPTSVKQAKERAASYYKDMEKSLTEQAKELPNQPNVLSIAADTIRDKRRLLSEIPDGDDIRNTIADRQFFDGNALTFKGIDSVCAATAIHLHDRIAAGETPESRIPWEWWLYEDPYGAMEHRSRYPLSAGEYYSHTMGKNLDLVQPTFVPAGETKKSVTRPKGRLIDNSLSKRMFHLAGADNYPEEHAAHLDAYLFENVVCKGLRLLEELAKGPWVNIVVDCTTEGMRTLTLMVFHHIEAIYKAEGCVKGVPSVNPDYVHSYILRAKDTAEDVARSMLSQWIWQVNYSRGQRAEVTGKEAADLFFSKHDLTSAVLKVLGSRPLLNMYAQLTEWLIRHNGLCNDWVSGLAEIHPGFTNGWDSALRGLFFETAFMEFCARHFFVVPEELLLSVEQVKNDVHFIAHREPYDFEIRQADEQLTEEDYDGMRATLMRVSEEITHGELHAASRVASINKALGPLRTLAKGHSTPQDVLQLLDSLNDKIRQYNQLHTSGRVSAEIEAIRSFAETATNTDIIPTDACKALLPLLKAALPALQKNTQMPSLPLLLLTGKADLARLITEHVVSLRMNSGFTDLKGFGGFNEALYLLACMVRRYEALCKLDNPQVLRSTKAKLFAVLGRLRDKVSFEDADLHGWWEEAKDGYFERDDPSGSWKAFTLENGGLDKPDVAFLAALRLNLDGIVEREHERYSEWLGRLVYALTHGRTNDVERAVRSAIPQTASDPAVAKQIIDMATNIAPVLTDLRALEAKLRENAEYKPKPDSPEEAIYHKIEYVSELWSSEDLPTALAQWAQNADVMYHYEELLAAIFCLPYPKNDEYRDFVETTLWEEWNGQ